MKTRGTEGDRRVGEGDVALSVVVPVYNVEKYLTQCLLSFMEQTCSACEVICVNDGSTDGSLAILREFEGVYSNLKIIDQDNKGVSAARNVGLKSAVGEYIVFFDADDWVSDDAIRIIMGQLKSDVDIFVFGGSSVPDTPWIDDLLSTEDGFECDSGINALFEKRGCIPLMCNKVYRRALLVDNQIFFDETIALGEDNVFQFATFPLASKIVFSKKKLYFYRCDRLESARNVYGNSVSQRLDRHLELVSIISCMWRNSGLLENNKSKLLAALAFLFWDAIGVDLDGQFCFAKKFEQYFNEYIKEWYVVNDIQDEAAREFYLYVKSIASLRQAGLTRRFFQTALLTKYRIKRRLRERKKW